MTYDREVAHAEVRDAQTVEELLAVKRRYLGRSGSLTAELREHAEREKLAARIEAMIARIEDALDARAKELDA